MCTYWYSGISYASYFFQIFGKIKFQGFSKRTWCNRNVCTGVYVCYKRLPIAFLRFNFCSNKWSQYFPKNSRFFFSIFKFIHVESALRYPFLGHTLKLVFSLGILALLFLALILQNLHWQLLYFL